MFFKNNSKTFKITKKIDCFILAMKLNSGSNEGKFKI